MCAKHKQTLNHPIMASRILYLFLSLCLLSSFTLDKAFASQSYASQHTYTVELSSLLPSSTCKPSSIVRNQKSSLEVVHKYGPCSHLHHDYHNFNFTEDLSEQILRQDQLRAEYIQSLVIWKNDTRFEEEAATTLPAKPRSLLGANLGNFFVTVGLGTPKKSLSLEFDTGSDLTWTQCQPCPSQSCYKQVEAIFDPSASSSYAKEPCGTTYCSLVSTPGCSGGTCTYYIQYGDKSSTEGNLGRDTLTLAASDVITGFFFGCGHKNQGLFGGTAGLLGLGRGKTSIVEQAAGKHHRLFSYCLPTTSSSIGYLTFGGSSHAATARYTPLVPLPPAAASLYALKLLSINIAGVQIPLPTPSVAIIDSGLRITKLQAAVHSALSSEFRKHMAQYPRAPSYGLLDTCYDVSGAGGAVTLPKMSLSFDGGTVVDLQPVNIVVFPIPSKHACMAFTGDGVFPQLGNVQQLGFEVVHDVGGARMGFSPGAC